MAERRMFAKTIVDSDAFLDMPLSSQALYFHLSMRADDDGFINNPKKIQRMIGCGDDDLKLLMVKKFILVFDSGVIVIKHWKIHNYIRNDRYKPTLYQEEKSLLTEKESKAYTLHKSFSEAKKEIGIPDDNQTVYQMDTQVRLGKVRLGKDSKDKELPSSKKSKPPTRHKYGEYKNVLLTDEQLTKLKQEFPNDWEQRIDNVSAYCESTGKSYKNYYATIKSWAKKDSSKQLQSKPSYQRQPTRREIVPDWANKPNEIKDEKEIDLGSDIEARFQKYLERKEQANADSDIT